MSGYQQRTNKTVRTEQDRRAGLYKNRNKVDPQAWKKDREDDEEESSAEEEFDEEDDSQAGYRDSATEVGSRLQSAGQERQVTLKTTEGTEKPRRRKRKGEAAPKKSLFSFNLRVPKFLQRSAPTAQTGVIFNRPCVRTLLIILSTIMVLDSGLAFYLCYRVSYSNFWAITETAFSFDVAGWLWSGLFTTGILGCLLFVSSVALIRNPEALFRYFGALASLSVAIVLLGLGSGSVTQALAFDENLKVFCDGGFPQMGMVTQTYIERFFEVENRMIRRYMCNPQFCPCSDTIDLEKWGDNASKLSNLELKDGTVKSFHKDCYLPLVAKGTLKEMSAEFMAILTEFEELHSCQGVCEQNLFFFFKETSHGPPKASCQEHIKWYFWQESGLLGVFGIFHGCISFLYFIAQFRLWTKFGV